MVALIVVLVKKSEIEGADGADGITELDQNAADRLEANPQNQPPNVAQSASCSSNFIIQTSFASLTKITHMSKLNTFIMVKTVQICLYSQLYLYVLELYLHSACVYKNDFDYLCYFRERTR